MQISFFKKILIRWICSILCSYVAFSSIVLFDMLLRRNDFKRFVISEYLEVKWTEIHEKTSQSIKSKGWLPNLFRSIVSKAKDFMQNLIREHAMPPKPVFEIDMTDLAPCKN